MKYYHQFLIRDWEKKDRHVAVEYGLGWETEGADRDVLCVEEYYLGTEGEFWVIEYKVQIVGTGAYYPVKRGKKGV